MKNCSLFNNVNKFYFKHKEIISYVFWGGCTTIVSISTFSVANKHFYMHELTANIISWLFAVSFAYITNHIWVFKSSVKGWQMTNEIIMFFFSRLFTLFLEETIIFVCTVWLLFDGLVVKVSGQFIVLIINYLISKLITFKKNWTRRNLHYVF